MSLSQLAENQVELCYKFAINIWTEEKGQEKGEKNEIFRLKLIAWNALSL